MSHVSPESVVRSRPVARVRLARRASILFQRDLAQRLVAYCRATGQNLDDVVGEAVTRHLDGART